MIHMCFITYKNAMQLSRCRAGAARRPLEGAPSGPNTARLPPEWEFIRALGLPRKEVIQPHVLVRLPCYDFTPLTLHTFGASLARLGRRLRVQTTRVV